MPSDLEGLVNLTGTLRCCRVALPHMVAGDCEFHVGRQPVPGETA
jgi:hypothetical protein